MNPEIPEDGESRLKNVPWSGASLTERAGGTCLWDDRRRVDAIRGRPSSATTG